MLLRTGQPGPIWLGPTLPTYADEAGLERSIGYLSRLIIAAMTLAVLGCASLFLVMPQLAFDPAGLKPAERITAANSVRTIVLQILAGIALLTTAYIALQTFRLNRRGQLSDRFTRAIDQIGQLEPEKLAIRLGGIYALEQIAIESEELHWPVMEVLTAFLRNNSAEMPTPLAADLSSSAVAAVQLGATAPPQRWLRADLQAIATVLGRRPSRRRRIQDDRWFDLSGVNLPRVHFVGASLPQAAFTGARLHQALFLRTDAANASFIGAELQQARFLEVSLYSACFIDANLQGAEFTDAKLNEAIFDGAQLQGADFTKTSGLTSISLKNAVLDSRTRLPFR